MVGAEMEIQALQLTTMQMSMNEALVLSYWPVTDHHQVTIFLWEVIYQILEFVKI